MIKFELLGEKIQLSSEPITIDRTRDTIVLNYKLNFFRGKLKRRGKLMIRKMQITDYKGLYDLWLSCKGMGLNDVDDSEAGIARFLERNPDTCFVAETDQKITGAIMAGSDGRRGYIYHTAVHPEYRMQGIGASLVEAAMTALKNIGITKVALVVFERNQTGNAFWEKQGFTVRTDIVYRNKTIVEMTRFDT